MRQLPRHTDVLIVGAGPVGLTLAVTLAQLGISHVIIDSKPAAAPGTKAAAIQPRTLEYLDRIGLADTLIGDGLRGGGFAVVDRDRPLMRMSYESIASPYPFLLLIGQQQTEVRLAARLEALGGYVYRSASLLDLHDDFPGTAATIVDADGMVHAVNARYVAGADGVHSTTRRLAGIEFPGDAPEALFALADIVVSGPETDLDTTFSLSPQGMLITSALPGNQLRVVAGVPLGTPAPDTAAVADLLQTRGGGRLRDAKLESVASSSAYHVQQRVATALRIGNVFLLGDAAHTHSPAGGQGMNTGIQDAANLGWKLHHVLIGRAPAEMLDTYDAERRPVAAGLIAFTSQLMQIATITDPGSAELRNNALSAVTGVPGVTDFLANKLSQLDIGYGGGSTEGSDDIGNRVDPRVSQPHGLAWTLVTPPGVDVTPIDDELTATATPEVDHPVAVRPDGIVAEPGLFTTLFGIELQKGSNTGEHT
jgi:2-polyprenyl-6-methoxyphenol hydroxylase-like FAD-dependent oxidoreductase